MTFHQVKLSSSFISDTCWTSLNLWDLISALTVQILAEHHNTHPWKEAAPSEPYLHFQPACWNAMLHLRISHVQSLSLLMQSWFSTRCILLRPGAASCPPALNWQCCFSFKSLLLVCQLIFCMHIHGGRQQLSQLCFLPHPKCPPTFSLQCTQVLHLHFKSPLVMTVDCSATLQHIVINKDKDK